MASSRLLLHSKPHGQLPFGHRLPGESGRAAACLGKAPAFYGDLRRPPPKLLAERRLTDVSVKASPVVAPEGVSTTDLRWNQTVDLAFNLVADAAEGAIVFLRTAAKWRPRKMDIQVLVERVCGHGFCFDIDQRLNLN